MIGQSILHYKILEKLGEGGMGVVYLAEDSRLERQVAIKFLPHHIAASTEERRRFEVEAKTTAALSHHNLATIYAIEEYQDQLFLVMEYIDGQELKSIINNQLSINNILDYAIQIAKGLQAAHNKGIVHRDMRWTRDGRHLIYRGQLAGEWHILKVAVSGGDPEIFAEITGGSHISFSPDYSRIMDVTGHSTMWVSLIASADARPVFPVAEIDFRIDYPVWSPDGKWVLFDRVKPRGGDIWVMENFD